ncbi:MAG: radical SAM protein [Desulfoarculaceae bacterium]|nr:radical SAM protein [Desulfoarculaceae bacterium]
MSSDMDRRSLLEQERGSYLKKWTGQLPIALIYPNSYAVGMSSLGFQLVYALLGEMEGIVCERFFYSGPDLPLRSLESGRTLDSFPLVFVSINFEHDYLNIVRLLLAGSLPPFAENREDRVRAGQPLVVCGGVATFMNPEPLAPFVDLFVLGEAEPVLAPLVAFLAAHIEGGGGGRRPDLLKEISLGFSGCYAPSLYTPAYDQNGSFRGHIPAPGLPDRIRKTTVLTCDRAAHSQMLTPNAEFSNLYLTELGRGCSRGCRFCAAGFIYRPPRLWDVDAILSGLAERPDSVERIGLLGMEMADHDSLDFLSSYLLDSGCSLAFSSLRADRISGPLLSLLQQSRLKSVAIAPDGASERLRRVINKGLTADDLLTAAEGLARAGLYKLKLYLMIGLPTETVDDLEEMLELISRIKGRIQPIGRSQGRLCEITLSVNSFTPKPWTPFQFHPFGVSERLAPGESADAASAVRTLKGKIKFLQQGVKKEANVRMTCDKPEHVLFQAVLSRGDRRLAPVLFDMASRNLSWKQAMRKNGLLAEQFAVRGYGCNEPLPWNIVDHGIKQQFLWDEYTKAFAEKPTTACDTKVCRRCGVCND